MAQLKQAVDPFGEVNVYPSGNKLCVVATILMEPHKEGAQTGIALDGSGSMSQLYGINSGGPISPLFQKKAAPPNVITPVAQKLCAYLARKIDADGGTTCIYWATGPAGGRIEEVGDFRAEEAERHTFGPPKAFGTGTQLLPAVKYFVERFKDAPWGFYVFITDGELHDLEDVKRYSTQLAKAVAAGKRLPLKFVLIGIGKDVNEKQMEELDDLDTGTDVDLWDHKLAAELTRLEQIFAEVVDANARVADRGKILDPSGRTVKDYSDTGLPAKLEFEVPAGTAYFTLEVNGNRIHQGLTDDAAVPASEIAAGGVAETTSIDEEPAKAAEPVAKAEPIRRAEPRKEQAFEDLAEVEPAEELEVLPVLEEEGEPAASNDADWMDFNLEFEKKDDIDLDVDKDNKKKK
ncbi:MAG: VWA domain-containing protein [Gemmataceae bacterium]